jgi:hypothetical protein
MTTRKPKLNLLYATDSTMPWLQLAVVTTEPNPSQQHARQWQSVRHACQPRPDEVIPPMPPRKH